MNIENRPIQKIYRLVFNKNKAGQNNGRWQFYSRQSLDKKCLLTVKIKLIKCLKLTYYNLVVV